MPKNEGQRWRPWMSLGFLGGRDAGRDTCEKKKVLRKAETVKNVPANRSDKELAMSPL